MGTRGHVGGLSEATLRAALLLDAAGEDLVFVETVGTGQSEIEVIGVADTVLLVLMPGSGDSIQALKADHGDPRRSRSTRWTTRRDDVERGSFRAALDRERAWKVPIVLTEAQRGERRRAWAKIGEHRAYLERDGLLRSGAGGTSRVRCSRSPLRGESAPPARRRRGSRAAPPADEVADRELDPLSAVREVEKGVPDRWRESTRLRSARARADPGIARVAIHGSETLSRLAGRPVHLKAENLQRTGSFKMRGAVNKLATLDGRQRAAGVVAASAGNHAQAVAWAAREAGIPATIFVPEDAPMAKVEATKSYGAGVEMGGEALEEAIAAARAYVEESGATFVHPYEDEAVVAGQGTIGLELDEQVPEAETVLVPIGGGGLASGIGLALGGKTRVIGVRAAPETFSVADGDAVK